MKQIKMLKLSNGREPFRDWIMSLEKVFRSRIDRKLSLLQLGLRGKNIKALGDGVFELKIRLGGGLRIYFGEKNNTIVILIFGGNKSSQSRDIKRAKDYWRMYNENN